LFALRMLLEFLAILFLIACFFWLWLRRPNRMSRSLLIICLIVAACSSYYIIIKITYEVRSIIQIGSYIFSTTKEQRREIAYRNIGYVYVRDIVKHLPEPEIFPITRYPDFTKNVHLFLSENRYKIDKRILVGIDLSEEDHKPHPISAQVNRFKITKHGQREVTSWSFDTIFDYDDMTGFIIHVNDRIPNNQRLLLNVKIYSSIAESNPLRDCPITLDQPLKCRKIKYTLPESIRYFSFSRGRTAFKIEIDAPVSIDKYIEKIQILAVKVNLSDYTVVHRKDDNYTAIRSDFIKEMNSKHLSPWKRYLEDLTNGT
jgi:hypothetical protein